MIARREMQSFFENMHRIALRGMNYGAANSPKNSGEQWVLEYLAKQLGENAIIFDVGANTGQWATLAFETMGKSIKYFGFEPNRIAFQALQNKLSKISPDCAVFNFGFSDKIGKQAIYFSAGGDVQATVHPNPKYKMSMFAEEASFTTLDEFISKNKISEIDFLKIDAEGHELAILRGASQTLSQNKIRFIQFEFGEKHVQSRTFLKDIFDILPKFHIYRILQNGIRRIEYNPEKEIFIGTNYFCTLRDERPFSE